MDDPKNGQLYGAFSEILNVARSLNTSLPVPEIAVLGPQGAGKSALIESLLGHALLPVGDGSGSSTTSRVVHVNVVNNKECAEPRVTLKRDGSEALGEQFPKDVVVDLGEVADKVQERFRMDSAPIQLTYEYANAWNFTLIDMPGLLPNPGAASASASADGSSSGKKKSSRSKSAASASGMGFGDVEEVFQSVASVPGRLLVFVEDVAAGNTATMLAYAKRVDPKLERSVFVINKFNDQLQGFASARDVNKHFSSVTPTDATVFFTTLLSGEERASLSKGGFKGREKMLEALEDKTAADIAALEDLQFDRRFQSTLGVAAVRAHLVDWTWRRHQESVPDLVKKLKYFARTSGENLAQTQSLIAKMDTAHLRGTAARYSVSFLQALEKLLTGSLEGNPSLNGQTLEEEKEAADDAGGEWFTSLHTKHFSAGADAKEASVSTPQADAKLYGGQQFERLLAEFKRVADSIEFAEIAEGEVATAIGASKATTDAAITWAVSDIVQKQVTRHLKPLVPQLFKRATYILGRLGGIAATLASSDVGATPSSPDAGLDMNEFPFFTHAVRDLYTAFVSEAAEAAAAKCEDEFMTTRLIQWEAKRVAGALKDKPKDAKAADAVVGKLANDLYTEIRNRIVQNVILKAYNFFFVPVQTELWADIQGKVTCFTDAQLDEAFEVGNTLDRLKDEKLYMDTFTAKLAEREAELLQHTTIFSVCPVL